MQPKPMIPARAIFVRQFICKFQTMKHGNNPRTKSAIAATTLAVYAIPTNALGSIHLPLFVKRFQKKSTGVHSKMLTRTNIVPTRSVNALIVYRITVWILLGVIRRRVMAMEIFAIMAVTR